jgi:hypothetical protein
MKQRKVFMAEESEEQAVRDNIAQWPILPLVMNVKSHTQDYYECEEQRRIGYENEESK